MSLTPPDLGRPYSTEADRAHARESLLQYWEAIRALIKLADQPDSAWTPQQEGLFPRSVPGGPPEPAQQRLQRWSNLYNEEINVIQDYRNRLVHGSRGDIVTDPELRGANFIARQIISTVMGVLPSQANPEWAFRTLAPAAAS